jgi:hypothetical protein
MRPRAIEQFADVKTGYVAESVSPVLHPRSKVVTGIKINTTFYLINDRKRGRCNREVRQVSIGADLESVR